MSSSVRSERKPSFLTSSSILGSPNPHYGSMPSVALSSKGKVSASNSIVSIASMGPPLSTIRPRASSLYGTPHTPKLQLNTSLDKLLDGSFQEKPYTPLSSRRVATSSPSASSVGRTHTDDDVRDREMDMDKDRLRVAHAELKLEREKRKEFEDRALRAEQASHRTRALDARNQSLEKLLEDRASEITVLSRKRAELEENILRLQTSGSSKVLEGRLAGAQTLLAEKNMSMEEDRASLMQAHAQIDELRNEVAAKNIILGELERQIGQKGAILATNQSEISRMQSIVDTAGKELSSQIEKNCQREKGQLMSDAEQVRMASELREELRTRNKELLTLEAKVKDLTEDAEGQSSMNAMLREKIAQQDQHLAASLGKHELLSKEREVLEAESSQKGVLLDGVRMELEREIQRSKKLTEELRASDAQVDSLEARLRESQTTLARKSALESKLEVLEGALARNEQDFDAELMRHKQTKQRAQELEEKVSQIPWLQKNVKDLEGEIATKQEAIAQLKKAGERKLAQQDDTKVALSLQDARVKEYEDEVKQLTEQRDELQQRVSDLEVDAMRRSGIEGKAKGLQGVLEQREAEIEELSTRNNVLMNRLRDSELEMEGYARLKADLSQSNATQQELELEVEKLTATIAGLEREGERQKQTLQHKEECLEEMHEKAHTHEHKILNLKQEVAHKAVLNDEYEETRIVLQKSTSELESVSTQLECTEAKASVLYQEKVRLEARIETLETKVEEGVERIQELQVELGAKSMELENYDNEIAKYSKEAEWRTQQAELLADQQKRISDELATKTEAVGRLEDREKRRSDLVENLRSEITDQQASIDRFETSASDEKEKRIVAETQLRSFEEAAATTAVLEGKIEALEELQLNQAAEYTASEMQVQELKNKLRASEIDASSAQQLQAHFDTLRDQITSQANVIELLESGDIKKTNMISDLHKDLDKRIVAADGLTKELEDEQEKNMTLSTRLSEFEMEQNKRSQLEGRISGLETVLANKEVDLTNAIEQCGALQANVKLLEKGANDKDIFEDKIQLLEHEVLTHKDVIAKLEGQDTRRRDFEQALRVEIEQESQKLRLLENELQNQTQAKCDLEQRLRMVEVEAEDMLKESHSEKLELRSEMQRVVEEKKALEDVVKQDGASGKRIQERLQALNVENKRLVDTVGAAEETKGLMEVECTEFRRILDAEKAEKKNLQAMATEYKDTLLVLEKKLKQQTSVTVAAENRLTTDLRLREQQVENLEGTVRELRTDVADKTRRLQEKSDTLRREQDRVLNAERKAREMHEQAVMMQRTVKDSEGKLAELLRQQSLVAQLKDDVTAALHRKEHTLQDITKQVNAYKHKAEEGQGLAAVLRQDLANAELEIRAYEGRVKELEKHLESAQDEAGVRVATLEAERGESESVTSTMRREMQEQLLKEQEKEKSYKKTIAALSQKCALADETLSKFEDFSAYNGQLRESNTKLREELETTREELEVIRDQVLDLQAQLSRSLHKYG